MRAFCLAVLIPLLATSATGQTSKPDATKVLVERIVDWAGGKKAFDKLENITFRERRLGYRGRANYGSLWLLAPRKTRARWETLEDKPHEMGRSMFYEIMVMDTPSRKNLVTIPPRPRGRVSLWAQWHETRRYLLLPFRILDPKARLKLLPAQDDDPKTQRRLLVTWPETRNYEYVDQHELMVEKDTGRIAGFTHISGTKGQRRSGFAIDAWTRVGKLRLPTTFTLKKGRGNNRLFDKIQVNVELPEDVWKRGEKLIAKLKVKPKPKPEVKPKR